MKGKPAPGLDPALERRNATKDTAMSTGKTGIQMGDSVCGLD